MFGQARKIVDFIGIAHYVVQFEGFGLKDPFHFVGSGFIGLGLVHPFCPRLGKKLIPGGEVTKDVLLFGVPGPDQFVGVRDDCLLPEGMNVGDQDFITVAFDPLVRPQAHKGLPVKNGILAASKLNQGWNDVAIHGEGGGFAWNDFPFPLS